MRANPSGPSCVSKSAAIMGNTSERAAISSSREVSSSSERSSCAESRRPSSCQERLLADSGASSCQPSYAPAAAASARMNHSRRKIKSPLERRKLAWAMSSQARVEGTCPKCCCALAKRGASSLRYWRTLSSAVAYLPISSSEAAVSMRMRFIA